MSIDRLDAIVREQAWEIYSATRDALGDQWDTLTERDRAEIQLTAERVVELEWQRLQVSVDEREVLAVVASVKNWTAVSSIRSAIVVNAFGEAVMSAGRKMGAVLLQVGARVLGGL